MLALQAVGLVFSRGAYRKQLIYYATVSRRNRGLGKHS